MGGAIDLAKTLLGGGPATNAQVDAILTGRDTARLPLPAAIPVYIAYFTAGPSSEGTIRYFPNIYQRPSHTVAPVTAPRLPRPDAGGAR